jgi:NAD(P)-dependent dehydrogenase (short-subunit alcohol dehydrogenase family)
MLRNDLFSLVGKRALVTGATRGMGRAIATEMARTGASVTISSENAEDCARTETELSSEGLLVRSAAADCTRPQDMAALAAAATAHWGGLDILVCHAGLNTYEGPVTDISAENWTRMLRINLESILALAREVIPAMAAQRDGVMLVTSSIAGLRGNKRIGAYGITKAASAELVRNLAVEWGPSNVRVNAISPGLIETEFAKPILDDKTYLSVRLERTPLRRVGTPREIAGTAVFLASPAGAFLTGQNIIVDGGTMISD